ncbi:hypothetical protein ABZ501_27260 [Streptomyces sp. NPDC019922]|uniref:hypothetical protein n=1 Tax=Streptomyces TaxID=1883 RepID=UPI001369EEF3|nr:hypothetical protein [Streptomyces sp. SID7834]MYT58970.1 hypothetical protein [Streptomyces sp. SID7834]
MTVPTSAAMAGYVFRRAGRREIRTPIVRGTEGVHYADGARHAQIDPHFGVLRVRMADPTDQGEVLLGTFDPDLQWSAAAEMRCAFCGRPDTHEADGRMWVIPRPRVFGLSAANHLDTTTPPVCSTSCLRSCLTGCPRLRARSIVLRAKTAAPIGVLGIVHGTSDRPVTEALTYVPLRGDDRLEHTVAHFLTLRVRDLTEISLTSLGITDVSPRSSDPRCRP